MVYIAKTFEGMSVELEKLHENQKTLLDRINKVSRSFNLRILKLQDISSSALTPHPLGNSRSHGQYLVRRGRQTS